MIQIKKVILVLFFGIIIVGNFACGNDDETDNDTNYPIENYANSTWISQKVTTFKIEGEGRYGYFVHNASGIDTLVFGAIKTDEEGIKYIVNENANLLGAKGIYSTLSDYREIMIGWDWLSLETQFDYEYYFNKKMPLRPMGKNKLVALMNDEEFIYTRIK